MTRLTMILILLAHLTILQAQVELPSGGENCIIQQKNKVSYCVNTETYDIIWMAMQFKASDILNKAYLPPDSEIFKTMPNNTEKIWNKVETQSRTWAVEFDSIYVVTGIHVTDSTNAYYKAILKGCQGDGLGFYVETHNKNTDIKQYALTINQLENITEMDFWPLLDTDLQDIFEAEFSWEFWPISQ